MGADRLCVVIPYFQREPGILARALRSIAAQAEVPLPVRVVIVDDASPLPAQDELQSVQWPAGFEVAVIRRANGGPAAARNTALDALGPDCRFVAFLDSDDEWTPDHLARALRALGQDYDFYFSDFTQVDQSVSAFTRASRIAPDQHPVLPVDRLVALHAYQGDLFDQVLRGNVIGTPTVVYRFDRFATLRFDEEFTVAGEDYLFWMALSRAGARVAFSSAIEVRCGHGVNTYASAVWGTVRYLHRLHEEIAYLIKVRRRFVLDPRQSAHVARKLTTLREAYMRNLLRRLAHREGVPPALVWRHARADPATFAAAPRAIGAALAALVRRRRPGKDR